MRQYKVRLIYKDVLEVEVEAEVGASKNELQDLAIEQMDGDEHQYQTDYFLYDVEVR